MAISKAKLREMRENSAAAAARAEAKRQAELDKYMYKRNTEVANMLSTNEKIALVAQGRKDGLSISQIAAKHDIPAGSVSRYVSMAKTMGLIPSDSEDNPAAEQPSGVIDAAELTPDKRAELTAQAELDAGIVPQEAADKPERVPDIGDVYDVARDVMSVIRATLEVPEGITVEFRLTEGLCELEVADAVEPEKMVTLTWR